MEALLNAISALGWLSGAAALLAAYQNRKVPASTQRKNDADTAETFINAASQLIAPLQREIERLGRLYDQQQVTISEQQTVITTQRSDITQLQLNTERLKRQVDAYKMGITLLSHQVIGLGVEPIFTLTEDKDISHG